MQTYPANIGFKNQSSIREPFEIFENNFEESFSFKNNRISIDTPTDLGPWDTHNIVQPQEFQLRITTAEGTNNIIEKQQMNNNNQYSKQIKKENNKTQGNNYNKKMATSQIKRTDFRPRTSINNYDQIYTDIKSTFANNNSKESLFKVLSPNLRISPILNEKFSPIGQISLNSQKELQKRYHEMQIISPTSRTDQGFRGLEDDDDHLYNFCNHRLQSPENNLELIQYNDIIDIYSRRSNSVKKTRDVSNIMNEVRYGSRNRGIMEEVMKHNNLISHRSKPTKDVLSLQVRAFKSFDGRKIINHLPGKDSISPRFILASSTKEIKEKILEDEKAKENKNFLNNAIKILKRINIQQRKENQPDYKPWLEKMALLKHGLLTKRNHIHNINKNGIANKTQFRIITNTSKIGKNQNSETPNTPISSYRTPSLLETSTNKKFTGPKEIIEQNMNIDGRTTNSPIHGKLSTGARKRISSLNIDFFQMNNFYKPSKPYVQKPMNLINNNRIVIKNKEV